MSISAHTVRWKCLIGLSVVACSVGSPVWAATDSLPVSIEYFGINGHTAERAERLPPSIRFTEYNLDAQRNLENTLSADLPTDVLEAEAVAQARMAAVPKQTLEDLFKGVIAAGNYGLTRLPAVVFNQGDTVVYGVADVNVALEQWQHPERWPPAAAATDTTAAGGTQ